MRHFRFIRLSHLRKTFGQNPPFNSPSISTSRVIPSYQSMLQNSLGLACNYSTPSLDSKPVESKKVTAIVDELMGLSLLEVMDLVEVTRQKKSINEMPIMMMMMPGMGIGGLKGAPKGAPKGEEKKAEKTAFDLKLEEFDAAAKIKVIKEVRTFTNLGLKEAKDLVEKVPTLLKKGVTKEEAETIIAKLREVGAKVSME